MEEAELNQEVQEELQELKEEAEEEYHKAMLVYNTKLEEWKKQKHDKVLYNYQYRPSCY
jgi:hypothetical protein